MTNLKTFSKEEVLAKIKELKHLPFGEVFIDCKFNELDYKLILLTSECSKDVNLMDIIGGWRKKNEIWFASHFEVTVERTTKWFKERLIDTPDRLLFMIKVGNDYIGHIGLFRFDFENGTCDIDNIIRGEPAYPGIMNNAIRNMMNWGKPTLGLKGYFVKTFLDNAKAVNLYEKLGFKEILRIPMIQAEGPDGLEWIEAPKDYNKEINKYDVVMKLL